jgi:hypothetical protein
MDAGYWSVDNANACIDQGIEAYIATSRLPHGQPLTLKRGPLRRDADARTRIACKLRSKRGSAIYGQRKTIVEPVNGQGKEVRGLRRFLLRGPGYVRASEDPGRYCVLKTVLGGIKELLIDQVFHLGCCALGRLWKTLAFRGTMAL